MAMIPSRASRTRGSVLILSIALLSVASTHAQTASGQLGLPAVKGSDALRLDAALARLDRDPRDVDALVEAGNAALATHDVDAAIGFFVRAEQVAPRNGRALAGHAAALVQQDDPVAAIPVFDRAEAAGVREPAFTADRGLAWDLVGDPVRAQSYYRQALASISDPETQRRLALSQAIAGDDAAAQATLRPLLQDQDRAGWRTRAFVFAILGKVDEAVTVAKTLLPPDLADAITPYLRYMPRLTRAQQAAAANLGVFPRASDIGQDDPRIVQFVAAHGSPALAAAAGARGSGSATGSGKDEASARREPRKLTRAERAAALAERTAPPDPLPVRQVESGPSSFATTTPLAPSPAPMPAPKPAPSASASAMAGRSVYGPSTALASTTTVAVGAPPQSAIPLSAATAASSASAATAAAAPPSSAASLATPTPTRPSALTATPQMATRVSIGTAFGDIGKPMLNTRSRAGAVDIARLEAARARAAKPPPPPSHPSRIWVQLATGRDRDALSADWHRFARESGSVLRNRDPSISEWGARNRLLAGPFESEAAARTFIQQLAKANFYGPFIWVSPAGQVVDSLDDD